MARRPNTKDLPRSSPRAIALWSLGAAVLAGGAYLARATLGRAWDRVTGPGNAEHAAPDLALDASRTDTDRAPEAFRPDPTAAVPAGERDGLRPATGPAPTLVAGQPKELERVGAAEG